MNDQQPEKPLPAPVPPAQKPPAEIWQPLENDALLGALRQKFGPACLPARLAAGLPHYRIEGGALPAVCQWLRDEHGFNMLADVTALDDRNRTPRFLMIYNLYSTGANRRIILEVPAGDGESVPSVSGIWPMANWAEREVFDMFGIKFGQHPDLRRILLPEDWQGHPLRKEYPVKGQDRNWIARHLSIRPGFEPPAAPEAEAADD